MINAVLNIVLSVVAFVFLLLFQTTYTALREEREKAKIVCEVDKGSSAFIKSREGLASNDSLINQYSKSKGFIVVVDYSAGNTLTIQFTEKGGKLGSKAGKDTKKPLALPAPIENTRDNLKAPCGNKSEKSAKDCAYKIPHGDRDCIDNADDVFHGTNDKAQKINKSITEAA